MLEDAGAQSVSGFATAISAGPANESAQAVSFSVTANTNTALFAAAPAVSSTGTLTYTPAASTSGTATITLKAIDDGGTANGGDDDSPTQQFTITVNAVNAAPSFTAGADQTVLEDAGAQSVAAWATAISPGGGADEAVQTVTFTITGNTNAALFSTAPAVSSTGTLTYTPAANAHGTSTITLKAVDDGAPPAESAAQTFMINVTAVNDAPTSPGRAFGAGSVQANMRRSIPAVDGLLVGAADADDVAGNVGFTPLFTVGTVNGVSPVAGTITTTVAGVGTVVADSTTGAFTIDPAPGVTGAVTFTFTLCDNGEGSPAGPQCSASATASFTIVGPVIWFVDPAAATDGAGTLASPFNTLASADAVDAANHRIFVYSGTTATGLTLNSGEWLIGQPATGPFDTLMSITPPAGTITRPATGAGTATIGGTVTLATNAKVQGVVIATGVSAGLAGSNASGITVSESSVATTTGTAVNLTNATGTYTLVSVSTNGAANGILLDALGASDVTVNGGSIVNASLRGVDVTGGTGNVTFAGSVTTTATGRSVEVSGRAGGTVTFSGSITDAGLGINLATNPGSTISFTGGVVATTGANGAFTATGGGTFAVTGSANTLATSTGIALNVSSTTIGAGGLTFRSISSNGAVNGIVVNSTGTSGGLTVTGNGGTCTQADTSGCTGGQIANSVGGDNSTSAPVGTGIVLKDTVAASLTRMWIHDHSNYAIRGTNVVGFVLANSVVSGANGTNDASPFNDSSIAFDNLTGSATVSNSSISGGFADNFRVVNSTGSLNRITFSSDTIGDNSAANGNDAVLLASSGSATLNATIQNSIFTGARGDLVQYGHGGTGSGDLVLSGNTFSNNHPGIATGGGGLSLGNAGTSGATTMTITGNTFRDAVGAAVLIVKTTGPSTQTGTFSGNTIGVSGVANSGSAEGSALKLQTVGQGTLAWTVTNNLIYGYNNFGIEVLTGGSAAAESGTINTTITGNTITQPGTTAGTIVIPKNGIHYNIGTVPGDTYQACAVITGNSLASSGADAVPVAGGGQDVRLRQRQSTTIRLPGYVGVATDITAVANFVAANNSSGGPSVIASVNSPPGGGFTGTGSTCP